MPRRPGQRCTRLAKLVDHHHLTELEVAERAARRLTRLRKASELPLEKTLATLDRARLPPKVATQLAALADGSFLTRGANVLVFGLPGRGKTHLVGARSGTR